jgi:D-glycero-D-manno-heptose 1,7-bisphosphate phosphatase
MMSMERRHVGSRGRPAVFLDRDGVLNRALSRHNRPYSPTRLAEFEISPGAAEACRALKRAGFLLVVVSNQPDIGRGTLTLGLLDAFHRELRHEVDVDDIRWCPHDDRDACQCRKPAPGMLLDAAADHGIDLHDSFMVGDRWRDIEAGRNAGCQTVLIDYGWSERPADHPNAVVSDLTGATEVILQAMSRVGIA